ncbi:phosphoenolpyruvate carboxykinase [Salimicrobium jeotgali]|uniref:Phosphoenolpyruvate carboxykinase (ATP) n=1 Tax=Salimicrobium jeotgali TaxID=1230341 RepID=K2GDP6_9BACI|nr:phosphoenolpyruvate carboxykinase (ATP) [Salimicrobium jeotgali]EKE33098.1 phosphoenolpyruvate carboxykinase [Salimicrobium jeotgali]MBM7694907.1 phosphoenolpyruvate carboxykinase (ATP) [Salimicrobium jeotgali]
MIHARSDRSSIEELLEEEGTQVQLSVPDLTKNILNRNEGTLTDTGAVKAETGAYTGRSPNDKFIVKDDETAEKVDWGKVNQPMQEETFLHLYHKVIGYLKDLPERFVFQGYAGADEDYRLPIRVITEYAWHNMFARQMFIRPGSEEKPLHENAFTVLSAPGLKADPETDGTNSEVFVTVSFKHRIVLIGGTQYAGEIKKSIFSVMNYLLPKQDVLPMHCSANVNAEGETALFFGLSGTGKTTLSADPSRYLIGDDEHGWSDRGVFNMEGGCYAKTKDLSIETEPDIYRAIRFGAVLENVAVNPGTGKPDFTDTSLTENTRVAYPLDHIDNALEESKSGHPDKIIFLTADATGVLPPISKLTKEQAMYHFLSGYTSKLAGTERGVTTPEATFSACFGAPFLPLPPSVYAKMLGEKIDEFNTDVYLVNTGWTGGAYGTGKRMKLSYTRRMVDAALNGEFKNTEMYQDPVFGLNIPLHCDGVPEEVMIPRNAWEDKSDYDTQAESLAAKFHENFKKFAYADETIAAAGPVKR